MILSNSRNSETKNQPNNVKPVFEIQAAKLTQILEGAENGWNLTDIVIDSLPKMI